MPPLTPARTLGIIGVWAEARGEPYLGKVAVAETIIERGRRKFYSDGTVAGTLFRAKQFSAFNHSTPWRANAFNLDDSDPVVIECARAWDQAWAAVVKGIETRVLPGGAVFYHTIKAPREAGVWPPVWAVTSEFVADVGAHRFYRP